MRGRNLLALLLAGLLAAALPARADTRVMITGEWPPYTGMQEPEGGSITAIVRAALAAKGDDVRIGYFGWHRVRRLMLDNRGYSGSFPHYYSEERGSRCHFSEPVGSSPLGLVTSLGTDVKWERIEDLGRYRVGTVKSYVNLPEFDRLVAKGRIHPVAALNDSDNLQALLAGRIDAAIMDRNVFAYLLRLDAFRDSAHLLRLDPHVLVVHKLYVCFPRNAKGRALRDRFNEGLRTLQAPMAER
jgi:polar amino acid transport system substrate-binding protein